MNKTFNLLYHCDTAESWFCILGFFPNLSFFIDINECNANTDNCHVKAICANTVGSFTCTCRSGYEGNGTVCTGMCEVFNFSNTSNN